jgi:hypothetical protein
LANLTNSQESEPGVFGSLEPEPLEKKNQEPEPLGKKIRSRSRSRFKKKSGAGAGKKFAGSPALLLTIGLVRQNNFFSPQTSKVKLQKI